MGVKKIIKIKDVFHSNGGGNISRSQHFWLKGNTAFITFYICNDCGYVEEYLDEAELKKLLTQE